MNPLYMPICCTLHYNRKSMGNNELQTVLGKYITYKHQKTTGVISKDFTVANEYFAASIKWTLNGLKLHFLFWLTSWFCDYYVYSCSTLKSIIQTQEKMLTNTIDVQLKQSFRNCIPEFFQTLDCSNFLNSVCTELLFSSMVLVCVTTISPEFVNHMLQKRHNMGKKSLSQVENESLCECNLGLLCVHFCPC